MMEIGRTTTLKIMKLVSGGAYLDGGRLGEIYIPRRELPQGAQPGEPLTVFIYRDNDTALSATTRTPSAQLGQCAFMKVIDTAKGGVFVDWGLSKDLFVPQREQYKQLEIGKSYVIYVYLDERTGRLSGTTRLHSWLSEDGRTLTQGQAVDLLICGFSELGYKAVINNTHLGLIFSDDAPEGLRYGQTARGYVKQIRPDGKIDLSLLPPGLAGIDSVGEAIVNRLRERGGQMPLTDKSSAEDIKAAFGISKSVFKKAIGRLYKNRTIRIESTRIVLLETNTSHTGSN